MPTILEETTSWRTVLTEFDFVFGTFIGVALGYVIRLIIDLIKGEIIHSQNKKRFLFEQRYNAEAHAIQILVFQTENLRVIRTLIGELKNATDPIVLLTYYNTGKTFVRRMSEVPKNDRIASYNQYLFHEYSDNSREDNVRIIHSFLSIGAIFNREHSLSTIHNYHEGIKDKFPELDNTISEIVELYENQIRGKRNSFQKFIE